MATLRRALVLGLAFGLAAGTVELWLQIPPFLARRFGPGPLFFLQTAALLVVLGGLLGVALAPLLRLRGGALVHVVAMAAAWYGLERWVALEAPMFAMLELAVPAGGALLLLLGLGLARRWPVLPWAAAAVLFGAAVAVPPAFLRLTTPPSPPRAELPPPAEGAPDVVLVVLDTVRAGSLASYGYGRPTDPELAALAAEGALFLDATSPSTWSLPSHASLFTGRYPSSHGAHAEHQYLDDRYPTLAQVLERSGYETFCFTANAWISDGLGLTRGFAHQDQSLKNQGGAGLGFSFAHRLLDRLGLQETDKGGAVVASRFEAWARERPPDAGRPAFVFLNFIEAHFPYHQLPHEHLWQFTESPYGRLREISIDLLGAQFGGALRPAEEVREETVAMYDGGVAYSSRLLARVVDAVRARGTLDDTVLVVLADHGEMMGEHAGFFGHGPSLYQQSVGVPLVVRYPRRVPAGARVDVPVSTLGVFATILDLAGLPAPPTLQVGSLAPLAAGASRAHPGPVLSELHDASRLSGERTLPDPQMSPGRYRLLRDGDLKLVATGDGRRLLYDLAADPHESRDLAGERPGDLARMTAGLEAARRELGLPELDAPLAVGEDAPELDDATRERLRALGYAE